MQELIDQIVNNPGASLAIIGNLIIIESLLSVDNAAVLATMVMDLPEKQRDKALKYGIWGAYIFRGLAMIFAAFLIKIWWLKPLGGLYLLLLVYKQFNSIFTGCAHHIFHGASRCCKHNRKTHIVANKLENYD